MLKTTVSALLGAYVGAGLVTCSLERNGVIGACPCLPECWCKRPVLSVFRWVFPYGHKCCVPQERQVGS
jgi:hypothetical protein